MADEIAPVMTTEDWQTDPCSWGICNDDPRVLGAQIAIANNRLPDGHPRKITRADVEALSEVIADASIYRDEMGQRGHPDPVVEQAERLYAKLAALLPPEDAHG